MLLQAVSSRLAATLRATCSTRYAPQAPSGLGPSGNDQERTIEREISIDALRPALRAPGGAAFLY